MFLINLVFLLNVYLKFIFCCLFLELYCVICVLLIFVWFNVWFLVFKYNGVYFVLGKGNVDVDLNLFL